MSIRPKWMLSALVLVGGIGFGCFKGYELEDKEPTPGYPGGTCLPEGCYQPGECLDAEGLCFDPADPCRGIYCGGHGTCGIDMNNDNLPLCVCDPGYSNETYAYYCM